MREILSYCLLPYIKNGNSESLIFYRIAVIFMGPVGLERNWASLNYVFQVKGFGFLGKILIYRFQYSTKDDNSEFSCLSMVPVCRSKVQVIVFGYRTKIDIWELGIVTSKQFHVS